MNITGTRPDIAAKLKEFLESKRNKDGTAVSAAFIKDGELVAAFACGTQDGDPAKPATVNDLYHVGSVGKTYCALAVMKLVEMEKVELDVPVIDYLPRFKMKDERYKLITLRMCLNHSSGLPGTNRKNLFCEKWLGDDIYGKVYDYFAKSKLKASPGEFSVYCNDGYILAAMVVAEVSGMSFMRFLQEFITKPAGALSTCSGDNIPEGRTYIRAKGKPAEYRMVMGSAGVLTDTTDMAKIGYLFIDPKDIYKPETLSEMSRKQGKPLIAGVFSENFGFGWDSVNFTKETYDFGENSFTKDGGTLFFNSLLLVSKKYNLAAAIALTSDNKMNYATILCDLCSMLLAEYNINTRKEIKKETQEAVKVPVPSGYAERFSGTYYNFMDNLRISFDSDILKIQKCTFDGWKDFIKDASFDGQRFISGARAFVFEENKGSAYMIFETMSERYTYAQKSVGFQALNDAWRNRCGKKYIMCDANPADLLLTRSGFALTVRESEQMGVLCFASRLVGNMMILPAIPKGEYETEMFLDSDWGSRDTFAPFIFDKDGIEYLYFCGYTYIDSAYLSPLKTGRVISEKGEQNKVYKITAGKIIIDIPAGVRVVLLDTDLNIKYDSATGQKLAETCNGFILFINEGPMNVPVEIH